MPSDEVIRGGDRRSAEALRAARGKRAKGEAAVAEVLSGESWRRYCEALLEAGQHVIASNPDASPETRAAGFEYLLGLVRGGLGQALELSDARRPRFFRNPDSASRWGAENADNQYLWAAIDPRGTYRISGERGTVFDFLIEVKEGYMQLGDERNFATLRADEIACDGSGRFELTLSARSTPGPWMPIHDDARYVAIRQFFCDWETETPARFTIERTDGPADDEADPLAPERVHARLQDAAEWTLQTMQFFSTWTAELRKAWRPGELPPARKYAGGADAIYYGNAWYALAPGEALVVETELPDARYWQFQLCDLWFRSADWAERQTSINHAQAAIDPDGRFRCVVSPEDPGVPNWLDTGGELSGVLQYRFVWSETNPQPRARVCPLTEVWDALPAGTRRVSRDERQRQIARRRRHRAAREPAS